jgi:tetratricopeptide (TPR) repeat protein
VLGHVSAELRAQLGNPPLAAIPAVGSEARAAVQYALLGWFHAVASEHPLVVAIDNVHAIDEHSAVLAAALAKQAPAMRLLLVATYRSMAGRDEASALSILRKNAGHLRLRGLNESEVSELVAGLFGKTDDSRRLAKRLYERSAGSPYECMELLRYAVSRRVVRYVDGTWVLPPDIAVAELPARYDEVLAARLGTLGRGAVRVAEALSIQSGSVSLALCLRLTDDMSEGLVYRALDELVAGEVLLLGDGSYRFCHDIQRQALCERLDGRRRQELHRALAAALTESGKRDVPTQLEIGWHLLRGGEESRGADMLAKIGIHRELPREHAERAVRGLQAALEVYEREGRSQYECAGVLLALVNLSYFVNFEVPRRLGQRAVEIGLRLTGLKCARELRPLLGTKLALSVCLAIAWLRFARFRKRAGHAGGVQYSLEEGISMLCTGGLVCMATFAACLDTNVVERLEDELEPLGYFGPSHVGSVVYDFCVGLAEYTRSPGNAYAGFVRRVSVLGTPGSVRGLPEASRPAMQGGNFQMVGLTQAFQHGPAALETAEQIEGLGFKMQLASAAQVRVLYYAHRGELKLVEQNRERFEIYAMQCGSTWQAELWRPAVMRVPYFLARDTVNLRRTYEQLARQAETIPSFELYARCVHGYYLISRGDVSAGRRVMERVVQQMPAGRKFGWQDARAALATALNALGEHAGARAACLEALQHMRPFDRTLVAHSGEVERQLALADAGLGEHARALERIEALLREHAHGDNPLCMGLLHAARAEIAIAMGDAATFAPHLAEMERWFKGTENPALLAQCERLRDRGTKAGCHRPTAFAPTAASASYLLQSRRVAELTAIHSLFDPGATRSDLLRRVLERALFASGAASGHLFLCANREMELAASYPDQPPLDGLKAQLSQLLLEEERTVQVAALDAAASEPGAAGDHECTDTAQSFVMNVEVLGCSYRIVPLLVRRDGTARCVGAVAIEDSSAHALRVDSDFFFALADALCDHLRADSNHSVSHRRQLSTATPESVAERNERMDS